MFLEQESRHRGHKRRFLGQKQEHLQAEISALQKEVLSRLWQDIRVRLTTASLRILPVLSKRDWHAGI